MKLTRKRKIPQVGAGTVPPPKYEDQEVVVNPAAVTFAVTAKAPPGCVEVKLSCGETLLIVGTLDTIDGLLKGQANGETDVD